MSTEITIETLEQLATAMAADEQTQRTRLNRLCVAYARIIGLADPDRYAPAPRHHGDEDGHWDNSYPPEQKYSDFTGPVRIRIAKYKTEDVATSTGYYHNWRRVTTYGGLSIDARGRWWRADETGTGRVGSYAAHPGDCSVDCAIEWSTVGVDDLTIAELTSAEATLRPIAFPLAVARLGAVCG